MQQQLQAELLQTDLRQG